MRPGTGTTKPGVPNGVASRPGTGTATGVSASRAGVVAAGAGATGVAAAATGTRYASATTINNQAVAVRAGAVAYPAYSAAAFAGYSNAWQPPAAAAASLYQNPGYGAVAAGMGLSAQPVAYDYGGNVVSQPTAVYVNGDSMGTPQQYADQAGALASAGASIKTASDANWIPLGVFALVEGDATSSDDLFQLAVSPDGAVRGNYHNVSSDQMESLAGAVDKKTQRAAWTIGGDKTPVYEAGIANLTKDATPILIHVGDGQTRQMTLVRLEQPADASQQ